MAGEELARRLASLSPAKRELLLARLAGRAASREQEGDGEGGGPRPVPRQGKLQLSLGQQQLWVLEQIAPGLPLYNVPAAVELTGTLRVAALAAALRAIVVRHEVLRTRIESQGGQVWQVAVPVADLASGLPVADLTALPAAARDREGERLAGVEAARPFDLARGPLLRAALLRLDAERHVLLLSLHHIASDGWSVGILMRELGELYAAGVEGRAAALAELPVQYADYAVYQRRRLAGDRRAALAAYWRERLADLPPPLPLPRDRPRPPLRSERGGQRVRRLPAGAAATLARLAERRGATPFMALLAGFAGLLLRYTGQTDLVVGSPVANRERPEVEGLIGYFVNTLALRIDLAGEPSFETLLGRVHDTAVSAMSHQEMPFELLVEELRPVRDPAMTPIFQVAFALQAAPPRVPPIPGLGLRLIPARGGAAKFDLTLTVEEEDERLVAVAEYASALFDAATVERLVSHYAALLAAAAAAPGTPLQELPLLAASERQQLLREWNDSSAVAVANAAAAAAPATATVPELVAAQARRTPDALALRDGAAWLSYGGLAAGAARLAGWLAGQGLRAEDRVALCLGRSAAAVTAMLAVNAAGGAYVPLDPADPVERLAWMARDSGARLLLSRDRWAAELTARLAGEALAVVDLDALAPRLAAGAPAAPQLATGASIGPPLATETPAAPRPRLPQPAALAYVIYTSGSTGRPKGVAVTHEGLANLVAWQRRLLGIGPGDHTTHLAGPAFDAVMLEIWPCLAAGAAMEVIDEETRLQPAVLGSRLAASGITVCFLPTPLAEAVLASWTPPAGVALRVLTTGGDRLRRLPVRPLPFALVNLYGPTEGSVVATAAAVAVPAPPPAAGPQPGPGPAPPPIGRPIDGTRLYVLDGELRPVPLGVAGEICLAGLGVARGYLGQPAATAWRFVPDAASELPGGRLYRTGDRARHLPDGQLEFLGRLDRQVKVRGFRVEPGEIEAALAAEPEVGACAVVVRQDLPGGPGLVAFVAPRREAADAAAGLEERLRAALARRLPAHMAPALLIPVAELPLGSSGKVDRLALARRPLPAGPAGDVPAAPRGEVEEAIAAAWREALGRPAVGRGDNFFDLGGHSLLIVEVHGRLRQRFPDLAVLDLFRYPTIAALAAHLAPASVETARPAAARVARPVGEIAVIGMAGRFPGAADVAAFWQNLMAGVESIAPLAAAELERAGVAPELRASPAYVRAAAVVAGIDLFDAAFFGVAPREAAAMDPQHRLFLECAWEALESAGYDPASWPGSIGIYAGAGMNSYYQHVLASPAAAALGELQTKVGIDKDFLTTRVSYRLGLEGPSVTVQTACSTSLVAVHLACRALLAGECDLALAGGVSLRNLEREGYLYEEGGVLSPDGHCRAFDAAAAGTVPGDGVGIVVLRRLADAQADGDDVAAVIKGTAINNDGAAKVGYTAPGLAGQVRVVREALAAAGVAPHTISFVEAHGTGTALGDPIELAALAEAFGGANGGGESGAGASPAGASTASPERAAACAVGSVKTNIGHLDAAAGIAGLIKAVLALRHAAIPPSLHFVRPNPRLELAGTPFFVNAAAIQPWVAADGAPRRAGVSSFGIGGTNAHVVLEEAPAAARAAVEVAATPANVAGEAGGGWQLLQLSARTETALPRAAAGLAAYLATHPRLDLADVAFTLRAGRRAFEHRRAVLCRDLAEASAALTGGAAPGRSFAGRAAAGTAVSFLFPGQGAQAAGMARSLYGSQPRFRAALDRAVELLVPHLGRDLRELLFAAGAAAAAEAARLLDRTCYSQPALFAVEHALAQLWIGWGLRPAALLGHSLGEYVAACLAGVFTLEDALALVALRGRLVEELPAGAMLGVPLAAAELEPLLGPDLALAADNARDRAVAAGSEAAIADLERRLAARGLSGRRLRTARAFHSPLVAPAVAPLVRAIAAVPRRPPVIPFVSNLTGTWIRQEEAVDPEYWGRQLLAPVRFRDGLHALAAAHRGPLLEVGPGETLASLARRELAARRGTAGEQDWLVLASLPAAGEDEEESFWRTAARLWVAGAPLDPYAFAARPGRRRVALPTYPFERRRYWLSRPAAGGPGAAVPAAERRPDPADWFYLPSWRRTLPPPAASPLDTEAPRGANAPPEAPRAEAAELPPGGVLLFGEMAAAAGEGEVAALTAELSERLRAASRTVTTVVPGPAFHRLGDDLFALRPGAAEDYDALLAALALAGRGFSTILHLWSADSDPSGFDPGEVVDAALARGFYSLMALGGALGRAAGSGAVELWVISRCLHDVSGGERVIAARATLLGPCRVLPLELPQISCRSLDLPPASPASGAGFHGASDAQAAALPAGSAAGDADLILAEVAARSPDAVLAYRGRLRWVQDFEPVRLAGAGAGAAPRLRRQGVYLVTGGLGGIGQAMARWLARAGARLALVGRTELPPRDAWEALLAAPLDSPAAARRVRRLRELEAGGSEVLYLAADVADRGALARVRDQVMARFGELHGIIHAAGVPGGGIVQLRRRADADAVLAPKVQGTLALAAVFPPEELDFFVLCSSLNSVLGAYGQADYCAANAYLDAFAAAHGAPGARPARLAPGASRAGRVLSIAWDRWDEAGMAVETVQPSWLDPAVLGSTPAGHPLLDRRLPALPASAGAAGHAEAAAPTVEVGPAASVAPREVFLTRFDPARHWVLAEHRVGGAPLLPGTAFLELAHAAFVATTGETAADIRLATFVAPLVVADGETRDVFTTLRPLEDGWEFRIASRAPGAAPSRWQEHAAGEIARLAAPASRAALPLSSIAAPATFAPPAAPSTSPPATVAARQPGSSAMPALHVASLSRAGESPASLADLLVALPLSPRPADPGAGTAALQPALPAVASPPLAAPPGTVPGGAHPVTLEVGPRWRVLRAMAAAGDESLARLELPAELRGDLQGFTLHPALLDVATGYARAASAATNDEGDEDAAGDHPYLPFGYSGVRVVRPLPALVYSHVRRLRSAPGGPTSADPSVPRYAVTLYDESGEVLLTIDEYVFRRLEAAASWGGATAAPAGPALPLSSSSTAALATTAADPAGSAATGDPVDGDAARIGLSSAEGIDAFSRILARFTLPQVLVSVRDLRARAAEAAAGGGERLLADLADLGELAAAAAVERHVRPGLDVPYEAPRGAVEELLAAIWQELLGIDRVGIHDDFFALGGDSVVGLRIAALARERGLAVSPNDLFASPTVAGLALRLSSAPPAGPPPSSAPAASAGDGSAAAPPHSPGAGAPPAPPPPAAAKRRGDRTAAAAPYTTDDFPDAELSARDLDALLAQLGSDRS